MPIQRPISLVPTGTSYEFPMNITAADMSRYVLASEVSQAGSGAAMEEDRLAPGRSGRMTRIILLSARIFGRVVRRSDLGLYRSLKGRWTPIEAGTLGSCWSQRIQARSRHRDVPSRPAASFSSQAALGLAFAVSDQTWQRSSQRTTDSLPRVRARHTALRSRLLSGTASAVIP
jgi:hypothetical protein